MKVLKIVLQVIYKIIGVILPMLPNSVWRKIFKK